MLLLAFVIDVAAEVMVENERTETECSAANLIEARLLLKSAERGTPESHCITWTCLLRINVVNYRVIKWLYISN